MEATGQLHTPVALPPGKWPPVPTGRKARWASLNVVVKGKIPAPAGSQISVVQLTV